MNEALAQALASVVQYLGATPILLFLAVMGLGPWIISIWISRQNDKRNGKIIDLFTKQMTESERRYENNIQLVKNYEGLVESQREANEQMINFIAISTSTQQTLVEFIKNNWWCPAIKDPSLLKLIKEKTQ